MIACSRNILQVLHEVNMYDPQLSISLHPFPNLRYSGSRLLSKYTVVTKGGVGRGGNVHTIATSAFYDCMIVCMSEMTMPSLKGRSLHYGKSVGSSKLTAGYGIEATCCEHA